MNELTGDEPDLELGAFGEGVMLLQVRLYALGIYQQVPDGTFDSVTENAVRELQSQLGLDNDGVVTRETWEALVHQETQAGIVYQYHSPYDARSQIVYDLEQAAAARDEVVSEDGQWRWDGVDWQPVDGYSQQHAGQAVGDEYVGTLSADGQWRWDGTDWRPAGEQDPASGEATEYAAADDYRGYAGLVSDDGQWRWDGVAWQPHIG